MIIKPTLVVNIRLDPWDVYIGRAGRGDDGYFGNPFRPGETTAMTCLERYKSYLLSRVATDIVFRSKLLVWRGMRLGCFCAPKGGLYASDRPHICHGQIMAEWLDSQLGGPTA